MKKSPAFLLYLLAAVVYLISIVANIDFLTLIAKPIISSSILFYYCQECNFKINKWNVLMLFLLICSGILNLFEDSFALKYVILINMTVYSILVGLIIQKLISKKLKKLDAINLSYILLTFFLLAIFLYMCLVLIFDKTDTLYIYIMIYCCVLTILGVLSTVLYISNSIKANIFLLTTTFCYVICDTFYVIYYYYYDFIFFRMTSIIAYVISFYFLVNYFLYTNEMQKINVKEDVT